MGITLALLIAGCGGAGSEAERDSGTHDHEPTSQTPADAHNEADVAFASEMIPHHEQAIVMSDILLAKQGIDQRVVELAEQIKAAQGPEIETMSRWLAEWGTPPSATGHDDHGMTGGSSLHEAMQLHEAMGMMTEQELEELRQAQGVEASRLFLAAMIDHHEGAVTMAQTEVDSGQYEAAVHLAHEIIESQSREIDTMKQILGSL